jgi:Domain of unknown function (DUF6321)
MRNESLSSPQLAIREQSGVAVALTHKQILSLFKKSENSGHSFDTLKEVYQRGYAENLSERDGFNRVNSFVAGGAAADMDKDLFEKRGLWDNIHAKRERIKHGSGERMRKPGSKGAPTDADFKASQEKTTNEARKSPWDKMASALKTHTGKDLNASDARAKEALAGLKQSHKDYQAIVDKDKVKKEETMYEAARGKLIHTSPHGTTVHKDENYNGGTSVKSTYYVSNKAGRLLSDHSTRKAAMDQVAIADHGKSMNKEEYTGAEKVSSNHDDPSNRFIGTTSLTDNYKSATPGQSSTLKTIKKVVREAAADAKGYKSTTGGLTQKGRDHYNRMGGHLQAPVTKKPSELKAGSKAANRRKSFCARMGGMKKRLTSAKTANDPDSRINKALRKWNC